MGKSKFPGKPSKLVNKKRISVLQGCESNLFIAGDDSDCTSTDHISFWDNENGTATFSSQRNDDNQDFLVLSRSKEKQLLSSETINDRGSSGNGNNEKHRNSNINFTRIVTRTRFTTTSHNNSSNVNFRNAITKKLNCIDRKDNNSSSSSSSIFSLVPNDNSSGDNNTNKPIAIKKKTVTFKNILETSDDACTVKKVYNPDNAPLVPIIKKPYSRAVRFTRNDCIVRPSRLTEILKNNGNNIDKLNFLTFRSTTTTTSPTLSSSSLLSSDNRAADYSLSDVPLSVTSSSLQSLSSKNYSVSKLNSSNTLNNESKCFLVNSNCNSSSNIGNKLNDISLRHENLLVGDKRFILPKRSAHSCRVIKPNKRFLDDLDKTVQQNIRKKCNTTSLLYLKKKSKKQQQQINQGDHHNSISISNISNSRNYKIHQLENYLSSNTTTSSSSSSLVKVSNNNNNDRQIISDDYKDDEQEEDDDISQEFKVDTDDAASEISFVCTDDTDGTEDDENEMRNYKSSYDSSTTTTATFNFPLTTSNLSPTLSAKVILRQPRLQYESQINSNKNNNNTSNSSYINSSISNGHNPFSLSCNNNNSSLIGISQLNVLAGNNIHCGVCGTLLSSKTFQPTRKFGIFSCEICRKFISKIIKKLAAASGGNITTNNTTLQCTKGDGTCTVTSSSLKCSVKTFKKVCKERCPACWLKKCIKSFHIPSGLKMRLTSVIPLSVRDTENITTSSSLITTNTSSSSFSIKNTVVTTGTSALDIKQQDKCSSGTTNLFVNVSSKLFGLSSENCLDATAINKDTIINSSSISIPKSSIVSIPSNPLAENNATFGSSLSIKSNILDKPVFMSSSMILSSQQQQQQLNVRANNEKASQQENLHQKSTLQIMNGSGGGGEYEDSNKNKLRRKDKDLATSFTPSTISSDTPKRQKIDLKGPRVKHVCRSASIVLGQPIATFESNESLPSSNIESMDATSSSRSESPSDVNNKIELATSPILNDTCSTCSTNPRQQNLETSDLSHNSSSTKPFGTTKDEIIIQETCLGGGSVSGNSSIEDKENKKSFDENQKPFTRKISRPSSLIGTGNNNGNIGMNSSSSSSSSTSSKNLSNIHKRIMEQQTSPKNTPAKISIDFWENYDPAEVSQTGFGLIVTESFKKSALCFLCGSKGLDILIFCACCCEPYHQYCVEDEYNLKHSSLDDTMNSLIDTSLSLGDNLNVITNRLNWLCPRCTVCYTCNMSSGSKVKCQKCQKNYHTTCLGTSKRLLGADRPLICANCLKCKSCGTTKVTKFVGNLPMCSQCFKLRQKGNFCPMCQRCYEDNDFDLKMMECGDCQRWVHAKCEGLSDEQYNLLSTLPENIEFVCKRCSKLNPQANLWREAVTAEFKSGLLCVVKLLSKRRQACALLKLSPRKITVECTCQPQTQLQSQNNITMIKKINFKGFDYNETSSFSSNNNEKIVNDEESQSSGDMMNIDGEDASSLYEQIIGGGGGGTSNSRCFCNPRQRQIMSSSIETALSLVDVKRKINNGEYVTLAEFNFDMNNVIANANCDELMIAYKEILSEQFPWFQNETKACTDALEEDMFDSCLFSQNSVGAECDQQVPVIDLPEDLEEYFYVSDSNEKDMRICMLCKGTGEGESTEESRLLYCGQNSWVHINCAIWSAEVFEEIDGSLQNVHSAIARGRMIKCSLCGNRGATVGCNVKNCGSHYHFPCARKSNCAFTSDKTVFCSEHLNEIDKTKATIELNFEILRPVYVELDRKKKKLVEPSKVRFYIGSLEVKQLGKILSKMSDTNEALIPVNFLCTRLYWSIKEPWKIIEYTVKTHAQNNLLSFGSDSGRNFTVDHSNNLNMVQLGLSQIARWHNSLLFGEDSDNPIFIRQERSVKQLLEAVGQNVAGQHINNSDEGTTEEEPQNNADLLPPEIKDAIFEDLPHEILDGISMLDILPKLMIYEDMITIDSKNENYFPNEYSKEDNISDDECNDVSHKDLESSNGWPVNTTSIGHVEDAMLSAVRPFGNREIKRSKSEVFSRGISGNRSQQRSSSLTWSCKLDASNVKRRKISKGLQDIRLSEGGVVFSIGRRKDDVTSAALERRRGSQNDDIKNKQFTWSAAKKYGTQIEVSNTSEKLRISQLDGMDDLIRDNDLIDFHHQRNYQRVYDSNSIESPVKCDRCNCTYRTNDSYERHLSTCEPLSTSESESETAPRSPNIDITSSTNLTTTNNIISLHQPITVMQNFNNDIVNATIPSTTTHNNNLNGIQTVNSFGQSATIPFTNGNSQIQNIQIQNFQSNAIPVNHINQINQGISNILLATSQNQSISNQISNSPVTATGFEQTFFSPAQNLNQIISSAVSTTPAAISSNTQTISVSNRIQQQQQQHAQPQLVAVTTSDGNQQLLTIAPQNIFSSSSQKNIIQQNSSIEYPKSQQQSINKNSSTKAKHLSKVQQSPNKNRQKPINAAKPIQLKKLSARQDMNTNIKNQQQQQQQHQHHQQQQQQQQPIQIHQINQTMPTVIRNSQTDAHTKGIVLQQNSNPHSIIVQQVQNPQNNIVQYLTSTADGNQMQYVTMPSATSNDFKQTQTPFLTTNPLVQGTFFQTDSSGNLVLTNASSGLQMISTAPIQIAAPHQAQPQVIGTLIQPQALQCGVVSAEQMVLGHTPTLEMVTNPTMLLTSQPVYYGLETIVQNTVMSSQQFVSTAMQGVLSQNASFSATTTQVFQASKIEPIMEVPAGYVVLNNVEGTIMQQPTTAQTNIISTNVLQQPLQQIQAQPTHTIQPQQIPSLYSISQQNQQQIQTTSQPIQAHQVQSQLRAVSPAKPTAKSSPIVMTKIQPQVAMKKVIPNLTTVQVQQTTQPTHVSSSLMQQTEHLNNNPIILSKAVTSTSNRDHQNPTIVQSTASATANNVTKVGKSSPLITTNHHHSIKPKTISTLCSGSALMPIQPVQRRTNMIRPLSKISAVTIKPKIVTKPVTVKNSGNVKMNTQQSPQIAPKPQENGINQQKILQSQINTCNVTVEITDHQQPKEEKITFDIPLNSSNHPVIELSETTGCIMKDHSLSSSNNVSARDNTVDCNVSSLNQIQNFDTISNSNTSNTLYSQQQQQQQQQQNNHQYTTITTSNQSQSISLPTSSSIQLPSAPFLSPFSNNIPTNIVNPIQQQINGPPVSRPTNRVLPMQTIQHKLSPPNTPSESKLCTNNKMEETIEQLHEKDLKQYQVSNVINSVFELIEKTVDDVVQNEDEESDIRLTTSTTDNSCIVDEREGLMTPQSSQTFEEKEMIKRNDFIEEQEEYEEDNDAQVNDFEMKNDDDLQNEIPSDEQDDLSESTTPEVKEKISKILENLENEDCNKNQLLNRNFDEIDNNSHVNININGNMNKERLTDHKENVDPDIELMNHNKFNNNNNMTMKLDTIINHQKSPATANGGGPKLIYEIQSEDGFTYKSTSITEIWEKVFEAVQVARKAHGLTPLPEGPLADMCGVQMLGLKTNALKYLIEQLPGVEKCKKYIPKYHKKSSDINNVNANLNGGYSSDQEDLKENLYGSARCEPFVRRSEYDMFSWLASRHRKQPIQIVQPPDTELIPRRGTGSNLPMAMKYRTLKETYKDYVGVFRSQIHGRGLYCTKDIEAGEMVIEYAGELIRSTLTDKRERYYDSKGIGCYMFKIDENLVVDATMRGNAARFINHSCEPNCYSKVVDILGHKHIIIFALRRIVQGEELTYDYKFPFEDVKIPCSCGSKKCRKYLN